MEWSVFCFCLFKIVLDRSVLKKTYEIEWMLN